MTDRDQFERTMAAALTPDPTGTVVVTVDLQRDYLDPTVATRPVLVDEARRVVDATVRLLAAARANDVPVVHAYATRRPIEVERGLAFGGLRYILDGEAAGVTQNRQLGAVAGTPDRLMGSPQSEVHPALLADGDVHVPTKKTLDSYLYSDLDLVLGRMLRPTTVLLAGVNTDTCLMSTAFSTANRGYRTVVVGDCCASMRGRERHEAALGLMAGSIAWVVDVDAAIRLLEPEEAR